MPSSKPAAAATVAFSRQLSACSPIRTSAAPGPGRHCYSGLSLAVIDCPSLGIYTVILLALLSFSVKMTASPPASRAVDVVELRDDVLDERRHLRAGHGLPAHAGLRRHAGQEAADFFDLRAQTIIFGVSE